MWWFTSEGLGGEHSWRGACFVPRAPASRLLWQFKKTLPAVSLSGTDLHSLCSKITAQPSTAVLMHMKQNGCTLQTHSTRGCTDRKAGAVINRTNAAKSREIGPAFKAYLQDEHYSGEEVVVCLKCVNDKVISRNHITFPFRMQEFIVSRRSGLFFSLLGTSIISFPISSPCW